MDNLKKIKRSMLGFIAGDMYGLPYEFTVGQKNIQDFTGGGAHKKPPFTWSDDSAFFLATFDSESNLEVAREKYRDIRYYYPDGDIFDIGYGTQLGLRSFINRQEYTPMSKGSGGLTRIIPLVYWTLLNSSPKELSSEHFNYYLKWYKLTHTTKDSNSIKWVKKYLQVLYGELVGNSVPLYIKSTHFTTNFYVEEIVGAVLLVFKETKGDDILSGFRLLCQMGGDTDTTCALYGALKSITSPIDQHKEYYQQILNAFDRVKTIRHEQSYKFLRTNNHDFNIRYKRR